MISHPARRRATVRDAAIRHTIPGGAEPGPPEEGGSEVSGNQEYVATVVWTRKPEEPYTDNRYSRLHEWSFDGGIAVRASAAPHVVPPPLSAKDAVDPEEAFVASLSSCHMLFFLYHAAKRGFVVDRYEDQAAGRLGKNAQGVTAMVQVTLRPEVTWGGDRRPSAEELAALHDRAHHDCYIANSVTATVDVAPR
jgi:organic hydroperoxide reductase OsmC/OhrA